MDFVKCYCYIVVVSDRVYLSIELMHSGFCKVLHSFSVVSS